jgi:AraC-like DNA-binding protein
MDWGFGVSLFNLVCVGVVFYGFLVVLLLLISKSSHRTANAMLAIVILIGVWYIITSILILTGEFVHVSYLFRIGLPLYYGIPPLVLLYIQSRTDKNFRFRNAHYLHFIPVLLAFIDLLPFYLSSLSEKQAAIGSMSADLKLVLQSRTGIIPDISHIMFRPIHGIIYVIISSYLLHKALQNKKLRKEIEAHKRLKMWLVLITVFFALIYLGLLSINLIWTTLPFSSQKLMFYSMFPLFVCILAFLGLHVFLFFNTHIIFGKLVPKPKNHAADVEKSQSPTTAGGTNFSEIEKIMVEEQLFKNPKVTAPEIANRLGMPPHTFSSLLNTHYGKRFPDFINMYRIEYVIKEFEKGSNESMSIEGIATEAGFASRSAFYNAFKKTTGKTPSEYLKR